MQGEHTTAARQKRGNATLWSACSGFGGTAGPASAVFHVFAILFLKYISDALSEPNELESHDDSSGLEARALLASHALVLPEGTSFYDLLGTDPRTDLGQHINVVFKRIEEANGTAISGVSSRLDFASEQSLGSYTDRNATLWLLLEELGSPDLRFSPTRNRASNVVAEAQRFLLSSLAVHSAERHDELHVTSSVSELSARLVQPAPDDRIADVACGIGSFLAACVDQIGHDGASGLKLYGQETDEGA